MTLENLGYNTDLEIYREEQNLDSFGVGRVISEHKERYIVKTASGEYEAEIIGNLRFSAKNRSDFPAVGDWVAVSEYDENKVIIHSVFPRKSIIERQAVGKSGEKQIIAANIDYGIIVQAVDRDFNINRIERYLTICNVCNIESIIILNKIDLISDLFLNDILKSIEERINKVLVFAISNETKLGYNKLLRFFKKGKTYCLLGSSGVGKSTLLNNISGNLLMKTNSISLSTGKGRHVTSRRELHVLEKGGVLIDNPGMREVGITDDTSGLEITFETIVELAKHCKFKDCTHINEKDCAILKAVEEEEISKALYDNFQKLQREKIHYESSIVEKRRKDKDFGKMVKSVKKSRKNTKY